MEATRVRSQTATLEPKWLRIVVVVVVVVFVVVCGVVVVVCIAFALEYIQSL